MSDRVVVLSRRPAVKAEMDMGALRGLPAAGAPGRRNFTGTSTPYGRRSWTFMPENAFAPPCGIPEDRVRAKSAGCVSGRSRWWRGCLPCGELSCRLGLSDGFLVSSPAAWCRPCGGCAPPASCGTTRRCPSVRRCWALPPGQCWARPSPWPCGGRTPPLHSGPVPWWC